MPSFAKPNMKREFLRQNRFSLLMPGPSGQWFEKNLLECKLPDISMEEIQFWEGTYAKKAVQSISYSDISFSCYMEEDSSPIYNWIKQHQKFVNSGSAVVNLPNRYKKDIIIYLLSGNLSPISTFRFTRCQLKNVTFPQLSYNNAGEPMVVALSVAFEKVILPDKGNLGGILSSVASTLESAANAVDSATGLANYSNGILSSLSGLGG